MIRAVLSRAASALGRRAPGPLAFVMVAIATVVPWSPGTALVAVAGLVLLPGAALLAIAGVAADRVGVRIVLAAAVSVTLVIGLGLAASAMGPLLGVARPLDPVPFRLVLLGGLGVLVSLAAIAGRDPLSWVITGVRARDIAALVVLAALPVAAVAGGVRVTASGASDLAVTAAALCVGLVVVTAAFAFARPASHRLPVGAVLFFVVLALALATTSRGEALYGWDIQKELSVAQGVATEGRWVPPADGDAYAAMLSLGVLPSALGAVGGLDPEAGLRYVFPVFLALAVLAGYLVAARFAEPGVALAVVAASSFASGSLVRGMPAIAREEVGLLLIMAMVLVVVEPGLSVHSRRWLIVALGAALAAAHYTSAYLTVATFAVAWAVIRGIDWRRQGPRTARGLALPVIAGLAAVTLAWNVGVNGSTGVLEPASSAWLDSGFGLLPSGGEDPLRAWLLGTTAVAVPAEEYRAAELARVASEAAWLRPDPAAVAIVLLDSAAPEMPGLAAALSTELPGSLRSSWAAVARITFQLILLLVGLVIAAELARALRGPSRSEFWQTVRRVEPPAELVGLAVFGLGLAVLLRLSSSAAAAYNPERAALHAALLYAPLVALALSRLLARPRAVVAGPLVAAMAVVLLSATGLGPVVFGGPAAGPLATHGEEAERFVVSRAEYATARWLAATLGEDELVQTDRYGAVGLGVVSRSARFGLVDWIDPQAVDQGAWLYATRTNLVEGRARGLEGRKFGIFLFAADFYGATRAVVFATEVTRVYR